MDIAGNVLEVKSILTLPEPAVRFSHINLPATTIYEKANLNNTFINYWQLLNDDTRVNKVTISNLETDEETRENIDTTERKFVNSIKNYVLTKTEGGENMTNHEIYKKFIQKIVPKTRVLFSLMKKYIHGKLSLHDIVGYLEPFLVYTDDLTFMQYKEMNLFLQEKISEYYKSFKEKEREYSVIKKRAMNISLKPNDRNIVSLLTDRKNSNEVLRSYEYDQRDLTLTSSELLWKMIITDYSNIYNNALALANIGTMMPENISSIIENIENFKFYRFYIFKDLFNTFKLINLLLIFLKLCN
jgi:hypothetical protein